MIQFRFHWTYEYKIIHQFLHSPFPQKDLQRFLGKE
jgi:hypothetical protein